MRMERRGNRQRKAAFPDSVKEARLFIVLQQIHKLRKRGCLGGGGPPHILGGGAQSPHFCKIINNFLLFYHGQLIRT